MFNKYKEAEWLDMRVYFAGSRLAKIRGIMYKAAQDKELLYAEGNKPISTQFGNISYEGQIKLTKGAFDDIMRQAIASGGDILDFTFDVVITYRAKGSRPLQTDTVVNATIKEYEKGWEQGAKNMDITLPIIFEELIAA